MKQIARSPIAVRIAQHVSDIKCQIAEHTHTALLISAYGINCANSELDKTRLKLELVVLENYHLLGLSEIEEAKIGSRNYSGLFAKIPYINNT